MIHEAYQIIAGWYASADPTLNITYNTTHNLLAHARKPDTHELSDLAVKLFGRAIITGSIAHIVECATPLNRYTHGKITVAAMAAGLILPNLFDLCKYESTSTDKTPANTPIDKQQESSRND